MTSRFKIKILVGGEERWADAEKVFAHLMEQYTKKIPTGDKPAPYKEKVENFFTNIDDDWKQALTEAYPNVNIEEEMNKAKMWLLSNAPKRNLKKFVNNWLAKATQNKNYKQEPADGRSQYKSHVISVVEDMASQDEVKEILRRK